MSYPDSRQTFGIGQPGQLVQIPGDAFQLGHEIQLFAGDPRPYRSSVYQLAQDFGWRLSGLCGRGLKMRSFRSGLSRVLTTYLQMRPMPTFGRPPCLLYVFFGVSMISGV